MTRYPANWAACGRDLTVYMVWQLDWRHSAPVVNCPKPFAASTPSRRSSGRRRRRAGTIPSKNQCSLNVSSRRDRLISRRYVLKCCSRSRPPNELYRKTGKIYDELCVHLQITAAFCPLTGIFLDWQQWCIARRRSSLDVLIFNNKVQRCPNPGLSMSNLIVSGAG